MIHANFQHHKYLPHLNSKPNFCCLVKKPVSHLKQLTQNCLHKLVIRESAIVFINTRFPEIRLPNDVDAMRCFSKLNLSIVLDSHDFILATGIDALLRLLLIYHSIHKASAIAETHRDGMSDL